MAKGKRQPINITYHVAPEPMSEADVATAERILAKLVARAFIADHPHLFAPPQKPSEHIPNVGPSLHRCNGRALTPQEDGPTECESEQDGSSKTRKKR